MNPVAAKRNLDIFDLTFDARMIEHSGIGIYIKNLLLHLQKSAFKIQIILPKTAEGKYPWLSTYSIQFSSLPIYSLKEQLELPWVIKKSTVFWTPHFNIPLLPIPAKKRLVNIHDLYHLTYAFRYNFLKRIYAKKVIFSAAKKSDKVITSSHFIKNEIFQKIGIDEKKIEVIYHGIDHLHLNSFSLDAVKKEGVKKKYQLPDKFFLFIGNHKPNKNLYRLLKSLQFLRKENAAHLVLVGKKEGFIQGENIENIVKSDSLLSQCVHILGYVPDDEMAIFYQNAEALILPSIYEGFGLTGLEAMKFGCPVIASTGGSLPEIYQDAALYIDPLDEMSIAKAMRRMLSDDDLKRKLIVKGKERAAFFLWKNSIKKHIKLLEELC